MITWQPNQPGYHGNAPLRMDPTLRDADSLHLIPHKFFFFLLVFFFFFFCLSLPLVFYAVWHRLHVVSRLCFFGSSLSYLRVCLTVYILTKDCPNVWVFADCQFSLPRIYFIAFFPCLGLNDCVFVWPPLFSLLQPQISDLLSSTPF